MSLDHFIAVRDGARAPLFHQSRALAVDDEAASWSDHAAGVARLRAASGGRLPGVWPSGPPAQTRSLLDLKIALADSALDSCTLCPHRCGVNRNRGETGYCGVAADSAVHWEGILHGEELPLVPSHEVFLSGCTMRCAFCYSHEHIVRPMSGRKMNPDELAACAAARRCEGASNLNLVGGEPTVHIPNLLRTLRALAAPTPVVWNSNMYATREAMELVEGVVDLFLGDIHFGNSRCAERLGRIPDYVPSVQAAFRQAARSDADVIIRHLVMPGHVECCARQAMEWAAADLPETSFHLMFQYLPDFRAAGDPVLGRRVSPDEVRHAGELAAAIGVRLYREDRTIGRSPWSSRPAKTPRAPVGDAVDILVHRDGVVSFARLVEELLPVAGALAAGD